MAKNDASAIALRDLLPAIDGKRYNWWKTLTKEQQDGFSSWLYMRYTSTVDDDPDLMRYYLMSVNLHVNKHFDAIRKDHPQLMFLLMAAASPKMGSKKHTWLPPGKKGKANKRQQLFQKLYPTYNMDEIELVSERNSDEELRAYLIDLGWSDKDITAAFKSFDE